MYVDLASECSQEYVEVYMHGYCIYMVRIQLRIISIHNLIHATDDIHLMFRLVQYPTISFSEKDFQNRKLSSSHTIIVQIHL